jgi:hypothetical protein
MTKFDKKLIENKCMWWNCKKTNQLRKQFKIKQITIQKMSTKFENKFQKSNDQGWNKKIKPN